MYNDILEESWVYQETKLEGKLEALQKAILNFVQTRFPAMLSITTQQIDGIKDEVVLQRLLLKIGLSQNADEALEALVEAKKASNL